MRTTRTIPFLNICVRLLLFSWDWYYSIATSGPPVAQRSRYPYKLAFSGLLSIVLSLILEAIFFGILLSWPRLDASMLFIFGVGGVVFGVILTMFFTNFGLCGIQAHGWLILTTVGFFFIGIGIWMPVTNIAYIRLIIGGELHQATPSDVSTSKHIQAFHFIDGLVTPNASGTGASNAREGNNHCALAMYGRDQPTQSGASSLYPQQLYYPDMPYISCRATFSVCSWTSLTDCWRQLKYPTDEAPGYLKGLVGVRTQLVGSDYRISSTRSARRNLKHNIEYAYAGQTTNASIVDNSGIVLHTESSWKHRKSQMWMDWWAPIIGLHAFLLIFPCTCGLACLGFQFNDWDLSLSDLTHDERTAGDFELRVPIRDIIARRRLRGVWNVYFDEEHAPLTGEFPSYLQVLPIEVMERIMVLAYGTQGAKIHWDEHTSRKLSEKTKLLG